MGISISFNPKLLAGAMCAAAMLGVESRGAPAKLKIGVFLPLTGGSAPLGTEVLKGVKLAVRELNSGHDLRIEEIDVDDKSEVSDAANVVKKLIKAERVNVLLGSVASANTNAAAPLAQAAGVPLVSPASTNADLTNRGEFISRVCATDDFQGDAMAKFTVDTLGKKTAAVLTDSASDYSLGLAKSFREAFVKRGGKIVLEAAYLSQDRDFAVQLGKTLALKPDVIYVPGYDVQVGPLIREARTLGSKAIFLGGDGWNSPKLFELAGDAIAGNYFSVPFSAEDTDPMVRSFVKRYRAAYDADPSGMAALGYDAVYFIADAFKRAGYSVESKSLAGAINATRNFRGVTGSISLDPHRDARKSLVIMETQKTRATFKQRVQP